MSYVTCHGQYDQNLKTTVADIPTALHQFLIGSFERSWLSFPYKLVKCSLCVSVVAQIIIVAHQKLDQSDLLYR